MGLIPDPDEQPTTPKSAASDNAADDALCVGSKSTGLAWFDDLMEGSVLGTLRRTHAAARSTDGMTKVELEVVEWTEDGDEGDVEMATASSTTVIGKRKLDDRDDTDVTKAA